MNFDRTRGQKYGVEHLLAEFSGPLEDVLAKQLNLDAEKIQSLRRFGSIYVNDRRCLENRLVHEKDYLRVHREPRRFPTELLHWPQALIFENESLVVVNKPSGLPVPATVDNVCENMAALLSEKLQTDLHVTHRLDVGTSGLVIFAKGKETQSWINQSFMKGEVSKYYRALVHGCDLPVGEWSHYMQPSERAPKIVSPLSQPGWALCRLRLLDQMEVFRGHSEVCVELITGRTHQIRAQLSAAGFPIVGDVAYGSPVKLAPHEEISLQAFYLAFTLPNGEKKSFRLEKRPWLFSPQGTSQTLN